MSFNLSIIIGCILLLALLLYKEWKRSNRHWLVARLIATSMVVLALVGLIIPIEINKTVSHQPELVHIITPGFTNKQLDTVKGKLVFTDPSLRQGLVKKGTYVPDLAYYLAQNPHIKTIKIYGHGLTHDDLTKLDNKQVVFEAAPLPSGITAIYWPHHVAENEVLPIQGTYNNTSPSAIMLKLEGFGNTLDSISIPGKTETSFSFKYQVRQTGKAVLQIVALQKSDTLALEKIPVQTTARTPINLIALTATPGFEYKFLKQWLFENQYAIALRSQISRGKFSTDFLNRKAISINQINAALLKSEELLLLDQEAWENLSTPEKNTVMQATSQGMGLIILVNQISTTDNFIKSLGLTESTKDKSIVPALETQPLKALATEKQLYLSSSPKHQILVSHQKQPIATQQIYGKGKLIATTLTNTYQWMLEGEQKDYATYWSTLINAAARKKMSSISLSYPQIPEVNHQLYLNIHSQSDQAPQVTYQQKPVRVKQNLLYPNQWLSSIWSQQTGWQTLTINQQTHTLYIFASTDWMSLKARNTQLENQRFALQHPILQENQQKATTTVLEEVSKWWFAFAFLLAVCFLWWEHRFFSK
jgi:hypothetical protein